MTARQDIFNALWWGVPSTSTGDAKRQCGLMLDAYRNEVLREAADVATAMGRDPAEDPYGWGYGPSKIVERLRTMAEGGTT